MAVPAWFWPTGGNTARTVGSALSSAGIVLPDWRSNTSYTFNGVAFAAPVNGAASLYPGIAAITAGTAGDTWASTYNGPLLHLPGGAPTPSQTTMPANIYVGTAVAAADTYVVTSTGGLFDKTGVAIGPGLSVGPTWDLVAGASTLYTLRPATGFLGTYAATGGATGSIALPAALATPYCVAASGTFVAVGGASVSALISGAAQTSFALNPANPTLLLGVDNGASSIWIGSAANQWAFSTSISGTGTAVEAVWVPTGTQALVAAGSAIEVLGYSAGTLSLLQTLALSDVTDVIVMPSSVDALAVQEGSAQLSTLSAVAGIWSITGAITGQTGVQCAAVLSPTQAVAGVAGSVLIIDLLSGVWTPLTNIGVPFNVSQIAVDATGIIYAGGISGASGHLAVISGATVTGTGAWTGGISALVVEAAQVVIVDPTAVLIRTFGSDNGATWTQRMTQALPAGFTGAGIAGQSVFISSTSSTEIFNFGAPYSLVPVLTGAAGFWNGSAWTTGALGLGQVPSAITIDGGGNAHVATVQNNLYQVTAAGVVTSGIVPQYVGQTQDVPLGVSSLCVSGAHLYAATSMPGVLVQVS